VADQRPSSIGAPHPAADGLELGPIGRDRIAREGVSNEDRDLASGSVSVAVDDHRSAAFVDELRREAGRWLIRESQPVSEVQGPPGVEAGRAQRVDDHAVVDGRLRRGVLAVKAIG
jgi:hypothetical protein